MPPGPGVLWPDVVPGVLSPGAVCVPSLLGPGDGSGATSGSVGWSGTGSAETGGSTGAVTPPETVSTVPLALPPVLPVGV